MSLDTSTNEVYAFYTEQLGEHYTVYDGGNNRSIVRYKKVGSDHSYLLTPPSERAFDRFVIYSAEHDNFSYPFGEAATDWDSGDVKHDDSGKLLEAPGDYFLVGMTEKFDSIFFDLDTTATGLQIQATYWNGQNWVSLDTSDKTNGLSNQWADITFTPPSDWEKWYPNNNYYYVSIDAVTTATVAPIGDQITAYKNNMRVSANYSSAGNPTALISEYAGWPGRVKFASPRTDIAQLGQESFFTTYNKDLKVAEANVNLFTGNLILQRQSPSVPARGIPVDVTHTYNSQAEKDYGFGKGWTISANQFVEYSVEAMMATYTDGDGTRHQFTENEDGTFNSPPGVFLELTESEDETYTITTKDQIKYNFGSYNWDNKNMLSSVVDRNGNTATYTWENDEWDSDLHLTKITDASGRDTLLTYDSWDHGYLTKITDAASRTTSFDYNAAGELTAIGDTMSNITTLGYSNDNLTSFTDARSNSITFTYENDKLTKITDPSPFGYETDFSYGFTSTQVDGPRTDVTDTVTYNFAPNGLLTSLVEPSPGGTTSYEYDDDFNMLSVTKANTAVTSNTYDSNGNLASKTNAEKKTTLYSYTALNDIESTTDALYHPTTYSYDSTGNLTKKISADNTSETYAPDAYGQNAKTTNARGYSTNYIYSNLGQILKEIQADDSSSTQEYDIAGNETTITNPFGAKMVNTYDDAGRLIQTNSPNGGKNFYEYDAVGNKTKESRLADVAVADMEADESWTGATTNTVKYKQGVQAQKVTSTNGSAVSISKAVALNLAGEDETTGYIDEWVYVPDSDDLDVTTPLQVSFDSTNGTYYYTVSHALLLDGWNQLHIAKSDFSVSGSPTWANVTKATNTVTAAAGCTATVTFDDLRLVANKRKVEFATYDELNRLSVETDAKGNNTTYNYDEASNQTSESDIEGTTSHTYDALNRAITDTDAESQTTFKVYDIVGNLIQVIDANESTTTFAYNLVGRETTITDPMGKSITTVYDAVGNTLKEINALSVETTYSYDPLNRLKGVKDGLNNITAYEYDAVGNQTKITPPAPSGQTVNQHDSLNRLTSSTDGATQTTSYQYDLVGRATTTTLPTGVVKRATYNSAGQLTQISDSTTTITYAHDIQGNKIKQSKSDGLTEYFTYDDGGQLIKTVDSSGRIRNTQRDEGGQPTRAVDVNGTVDFVYDQVGSLDNMKVEGETSTTFGYDNVGNRKSYKQANNMNTGYSYDDNSRLTSLEISKTSGQLFKYSYQFDDTGNITTETIAGVGSHIYGYDDNDQLIAWNGTDGTETTWLYDVTGNRSTQTVEGGPITTYAYDTDNRLTGSTTNGQYTDYTYDDNGNLTLKAIGADTTTYAWNSDNQLTSISSSSTSATFTYDAEGKRTAKTVNGTTTGLVYNGIKLIAEKDASGTITAKYFYDDEGQLVSMKKSGRSYYFHLNHRGDIIEITDENQDTTATYSYDPWGNILDSTGTFANSQPFRYASYYWDSEIGMYYLIARYYDPNLGRFISKDPAGGPESRVDKVTEANQYVYAENNSVNSSDPSGHYAVRFKFPKRRINKYLMAVLRVNAGYARRHAFIGWMGLTGRAAKYAWFGWMVKGGHMWDLKLVVRKNKRKKRYIKFRRSLISPDNFGNIHFGYVGHASGISIGVLLWGSGFANKHWGGKPLKQEKADWEWIKDGYHMYSRFGSRRRWPWQKDVYVRKL